MAREQHQLGAQVNVSYVASKGRWEMPVISPASGKTEKGWAWLRDPAVVVSKRDALGARVIAAAS
jgi:hypothetical protein